MALDYLPNHLKSFVEREIESGRYESEEQVIAAALERLAIEEGPTVTVAEAVAESLAQIERGEGRELTDELFDEMLRQSDIDASRGLVVHDDIRY